ncbi:MAG TPA: M20/M25/M40 family metallo-hydrolase [Gammaproteobacteria bacterium]|nr:M20/M25/M40 family metallo-hydrolase [Gammaproteobacteria bacterium]
MSFFKKTTLAAAFALTSGSIFAGSHIIIAPACLVNAANAPVEVMAQSSSMQLLKVDDAALEKFSDVKHQTKSACGGFKNVTAAWNKAKPGIHHVKDHQAFMNAHTFAKPEQAATNSYRIRFENEANQLISQIQPQQMWDRLKSFSSAKDRYANSDLGVAAANWIKSEIETMAKSAGRNDVTVYTVATSGYRQPSVIAKIGTGNNAGVVIGAHMDTTSSRFERKPGADDDGSGSMTAMESARTLISSGAKFNKPIYFIWYSAEEEGLVGSQDVVADFQKKNIPVDGVMHFDMTGYAHKGDPTIWLMEDNVDAGLTAFLEKIVTTYTHQPVDYTRCGYGCSDHASWNDAGYKAVLPAEARFENTNPVMHTSRDTIDKLDIKHMTDYAKIAVAFAVEMAEPAAK